MPNSKEQLFNRLNSVNEKIGDLMEDINLKMPTIIANGLINMEKISFLNNYINTIVITDHVDCMTSVIEFLNDYISLLKCEEKRRNIRQEIHFKEKAEIKSRERKRKRNDDKLAKNPYNL